MSSHTWEQYWDELEAYNREQLKQQAEQKKASDEAKNKNRRGAKSVPFRQFSG